MQTIVYVLTLSGVVLGVYETHQDAEQARIFGIHETKQKESRVTQCVVKPEGTEGF